MNAARMGEAAWTSPAASTEREEGKVARSPSLQSPVLHRHPLARPPRCTEVLQPREGRGLPEVAQGNGIGTRVSDPEPSVFSIAQKLPQLISRAS